MPTKSLPYVVLLAFLFGSTLIASRFSVGMYAPLTYVALRLVIASVAHISAYVRGKKRIFPRDKMLWRRAALIGLIGTAVPMTAIVSSLQFQSSGLTAIFLTLGPAITVILAHFFLEDERINARNFIGIALAFGGALLLALSGETGLADVEKANPLGYLLVIGGMTFGSIATIYIRRNLREVNSFDLASIRIWSATVLLVPASLIFAGFDLSAVTPTGYGALFYAALIGTFSGFIVSLYIIQRFGATAASMPAYLMPIVATTGGWLILDEQITATMLFGMTLIIIGIAILSRRKG